MSEERPSPTAAVDLPEVQLPEDRVEAVSAVDLTRLRRYAFMKLARDLDARFEYLLKTGKVSKWYSEVGNEATTVPAGLALEAGDALCSLHRDLGAILAVYLDPARTFPGFGFGQPDGRRPDPVELLHRLCCQLLGKGEGFSQGVERSFHYGHLAPETGILHVGMISHLGAMIPVAAGCAFAHRQDGRGRVAINFIGDGGTSTGDFHEAMNMAAVWKLPLVLVVENNRYAFSTPVANQFACERLSDRAVGYGIAGETVDGNDPDAVAAAIERAVERGRAGGGPTLVEAMLGRMRGHSEGDDSLKVVPRDELATYMDADPVPAYRHRLLAEGAADEAVLERLETRVGELVEAGLARAIDAALPAAAVATRPVFADAEPPAGGWSEAPPVVAMAVADEGTVTYAQAINDALAEELERDDSVVLMGQDIGVFEGAFRTTRTLHQRWPERVLDTPIAESGTLGIAAGAALLGYRPVVEMQFADFISCGFNQLVNVIAKLHYRWRVPCPVVVRLPSGGGVGAGPFHSQNPEGWFSHVPGLKVICPASAFDAKALLKAAIRDPNPVVFCEHKFLYRRVKEVLPAGDLVAEIGKARVVREGRDLTLVGYGVTVWTCLEAAAALAEEGVEAEVVDLRTLVPFDEEMVLASARKTGRVVVVHEDTLTGGFGAEVVARVADGAFAWLDAPVRRVAHEDRPSPFAKNLERVLLPSVDKVVEAGRELVRW
ncbi:MAG TPA: dehydrogenase E1 component subunit alpha/beta [Thermoanaerobaculia bacterium]|nr:dehydrogenase E1 component subunit alpha/beta [Thermoanaerobaculia bacterium]